MRGGIGNVPLSAIVTMSDDASLMVPTAPCTKHRHLLEPLVIYKTLYSHSSLVSIQLFFRMNTAPVSYKLSFPKEEWCPVSTQCHLLPFPPCLLCLPYQSFLISRRLWPDASWALGSGKSPRQRADRVCHSLASTGYSTRYI